MPRRSLLLLAMLAATAPAGCRRVSTSTATTQPAAASQPTDDWPAFHGGGGLVGVARSDVKPPLRVRWSYRCGGTAAVVNSAAIVGDRVYVADDEGTLHALRLSDGTVAWRRVELGRSFETAPLVTRGRVFLGDTDGKFYAVDAASGVTLWEAESPSAVRASANVTTPGHVVYANDAGRVFVVDAADGTQVATTQTDRTNGAAAVAGGCVWVGQCDGGVRQYDADTLELIGRVDAGSSVPASPMVTGDRVVVGAAASTVLCFDRGTGEKLWTYRAAAKDDPDVVFFATAACADDTVVVGGSDNCVHAMSLLDGTARWKFATRGEVNSSAAISGGCVYVGSKDGKLYALNLADGRPLWQFDAGQEIVGSPAIARGVLVFGDAGGAVYCLEPRP